VPSTRNDLHRFPSVDPHAPPFPVAARAASMSTAPVLNALRTEDCMLPSADAGLSLFVRNKAPVGLSAFCAERTVLFVHGATYASELTFDFKAGGPSWMDCIASRGYDVWLVDVRGYGRSAKPAALSQPAEANPPLARTEDAVRDVSTAVDHILQTRSIERLNLIGWSWGSVVMARYTTRHNERVNKLVLHAPLWTPPPGYVVPPPPTAAYRLVTAQAARERWFAGVAREQQAALVSDDAFDAWASAMLASDPDSATLDPPALRAPNGALADVFGCWRSREPLYPADRIRVPTLLACAEWDVDTPAFMAQGLLASLTQAPFKSSVEIANGTHTLMLERHRMQLFDAVQAFLDAPAQ
jgi:pimeloyl-ACP methyl ester carboxylesterase